MAGKCGYSTSDPLEDIKVDEAALEEDKAEYAKLQEHVIFVGNPGRGKSTLLNALMANVIFRAGVSAATGLTQALQTHVFGNVKVSDTPGLDNWQVREKAAAEISKAIQVGGNVKLVFVITTDSGRLRSQDLATIKSILGSIKELSLTVDKKYGVVVNKVGGKILRKQLLDQISRELVVALEDIGQPFNVHFERKHDEAEDENDHLLNLPKALAFFVTTLPGIAVPPDNKARIKVDEYNSLVESIQLLKQQVLELKQTLSREQEEKVCKLQERAETHVKLYEEFKRKWEGEQAGKKAKPVCPVL